MMSLNEELKSSQGTIVGLKSSMKEVGVVSMWVFVLVQYVLKMYAGTLGPQV